MLNIKQNFNGIDVEAFLKEGINLLSGDSGSGKTLFMQAVELYCLENNISYTLLNYRQHDKSTKQLEVLCGNSEIILIDNADLFVSAELIKILKKTSKYILLSLHDTTKIDERNIAEFIVHYNNLKLRLEEI